MKTVKYVFFENAELIFTHSFHAAPNEILAFLHTMEFDELNESPEVDLGIQRGKKMVWKNIRIKPKNFFNKLVKVSQLGTDAYVFMIELDGVEKKEPINKKFELNTDHLRQSIQNKTTVSTPVLHHPAERVVDLHIEKIIRDHKKISNTEIGEIQLNYFQRGIKCRLAVTS